MIDLIEGEKGIKGEIFGNFDAMIPLRSLAKGNQGEESILELGVEIFQSPSISRSPRRYNNTVVGKRSNFLDG